MKFTGFPSVIPSKVGIQFKEPFFIQNNKIPDRNGDGIFSGDPNIVCMRLGATDGYVKMPDGTNHYTFGFVDITGVPENSCFYKINNPGTYPYHCHFEPVEHVQLGMIGVIVVFSHQDTETEKYAYNDGGLAPDTRYDVAYDLLIDELDADKHWNMENIQEGTTLWHTYYPNYHILNGRAYPDTILPDNDISMTNNAEANDLPEPVSFMVAGQSIIPAPVGNSYTYEIGPSSSGSYDFTAPRPGTYLYESGTNQSKQVQMGLYGALIVRDYSGITYDREYVLLLSEIDPHWHSAVADGQPYNAIYFSPKYWLINGNAYRRDTQDILAKGGEKVLLRYLNAGSQDHVIIIHGMEQKEVANDGRLVTYPQKTATVVMNPGQTRDMMLETELLSLNLVSATPLYDRRLDITNWDHYPGGMITHVRLINANLVTGLSVLSSSPNTANQGSKYSYDVVAVDPNNLGGSLNYTLVNEPAGMTVDSNGRISWTAGSGDRDVTLRVSNGASFVDQSFTVHVNDNPVIGSITDQTVTAGSSFSFNVGAISSDPDGDPLTYSFFDVFMPLTIDPVTGVISWTPDDSRVGTYSVQVQATDSHGGIGARTFQLTVNPSGAVSPPPDGVPPVPTYAVTISPVDASTLAPVSDFKFIVNEDNAPPVDPGAVPICDPCPGIHQFESYSRVVATGTVTVATPDKATIQLPSGRYILTVLAGTFDPSNDIPDDLEMRNGGVYKMDGGYFTLPNGGSQAGGRPGDEA